jgi:transcriptional regulator with XRE-family HTH domain
MIELFGSRLEINDKMMIERWCTMKQLRPLPPSMQLAETLARRVLQLREYRNMTILDLSRLSRFTVARIEDIESGVETWLSAPDRQLLAKALAIEPKLLQEVETRAIAGHQVRDPAELYQATSAQLTESILRGARELECPDCGSTLKCSIQEGVDLEGNGIQFAKAFCIRCPFVLR